MAARSVTIRRNGPRALGLTDAQGDALRRADSGKLLEASGARWHWGPAPERPKMGATLATVSVLLRKGYLLDVSERGRTKQARYKLTRKGLRAHLYLSGHSVAIGAER